MTEVPTIAIPEVGYVERLPFHLYKSIDRISAHGLMQVLRSPAHYQASKRLADTETPAQHFGTLVHSAVLEPHRYLANMKVMPKFVGLTKDGRPSEQSADAKNQKKNWLADLSQDAIVVEESERDTIVGMIKAMESDELCKDIFTKGISEISLFWTDKVTGEKCKARLDYLRADATVIDYKSVADNAPREFQRAAWSYRWHMQAAFYEEAVLAVFGKRPKRVVFLSQEKEDPFRPTPFVAGDEFLRRGQRANERAMKIYHHCRETGTWPYKSEAYELVPPRWAEEEEDYE